MDERLDPTRADTPEAQLRLAERGRRIGRYRLGALLGQGGMGEVYLAEQLEPVRRAVALKVIRAGRTASSRFVARFELERQVLALMEHPNIAQLYDAGVTEDGDPYFVMERVDGPPITDYCDAAHLPLRTRLVLFLDVCRAIEHAHQKGVLHRDIKPSNVLVAERDGRPLPKVIDFGVAKALDGVLAAEHLPTQLGIAVGTLAFSSPEQLDPEQAVKVDTRTDVYGLGLLLYLLLVGESPFPGGSPSLLMERILRSEPEPLAKRFRGTESSAEIAAARGTTRELLLRELSGDLEWIARRALEKHPDERYPSVAELRADVERYLGDRPVLASPPSWSLRARKFARRNRLAVTAAALVALSLIGGVVATSVALVRSRRAEALAGREAAKAKAVNEFLRGMLESASPIEGAKDVKVAEVLDRAAADLAGKFKEQPEVEEALRTTLAATYDALGLAEKSAKQAELALALRVKAFGPDDRETLDAASAYGYALHGLGRDAEALPLLTRTRGTMLRRLSPDDPYLLEAGLVYGSILSDNDRFEEAEPIVRDVVARLRKAKGANDHSTLSAEGALAQVLTDAGRFGEAEALLRELTQRFRKVLGEGHPETLAIETSLGRALNDEKKYAEAEALYRQLVAKHERYQGIDHPETLTSRHNLVTSLAGLGRLAEAETLCRATLATRRRVLGNDHPHTLYSLGALGEILMREGRGREAKPLLVELVERGTPVLGPNQVTVARARKNLASLGAAKKS